MISNLANHLWQSTMFLIAAGLLTLVFHRNGARVRYWLWFSASIKFLLPFSMLMSFGSYLQQTLTARKIPTQIAPPSITFAMDQITSPFHVGVISSPATLWLPFDRTTLALLGVWLFGFGTIVVLRFRSWKRIRDVVRSST